MKVFNLLKIKTRIILLVAIPLVVTLMLAVEKLDKAWDELENVEKLDTLQKYVYVAAPLLSALQQEILYTKMYLGPGTINEPTGTEFYQDMLDKRPAVDKALKAYREFINDEAKYAEFTMFVEDLNAVKTYLSKLDFIRDLANKRLKKLENQDKTDGKFTWTVRSYQNIADSLIKSTNQVVLIAAKNAHLSLLANAFKNLIYAQDNATLLVSSIYRGISGSVSINTYGELMKQAALEAAYLDSFILFSAPQTVDYFKQELLNQDYYKFATTQYEQIRRKSKTYLDNPINIDKSEWLENGRLISLSYEKVIDRTLENIELTKNQQIDQAQTQVYNIIGLISFLIITLVLLSLKIIMSINTPLKTLMADLKKLADTKDMTLRSHIEGRNELSLVGLAFNSLISVFEQTLSNVREKIISLDLISKRVSSSMRESMDLIQNQTTATDNISVAINEMTSSIYAVSKMASDTSDTVQRVSEISIESAEDASQTKQTIDNLIIELGDTNKLVANLNEEAGRISNVLQVIQGISEQTNLLALNAAIEAARAGEMGRGFAVVADEVRSLSKRTQDSTGQIQSQIEELISGASLASEKMDTLQKSGLAAVSIVEKSTQSFGVIKAELEQITDMSGQIAVAAEQQTNVADEINKRIHAIKDDSETLHEKSSDTLSSIETLSNNGEQLLENISLFHFK